MSAKEKKSKAVYLYKLLLFIGCRWLIMQGRILVSPSCWRRFHPLIPSVLNFIPVTFQTSIAILFCVLMSLTGRCIAQTQCTDNSGCFPPVGNLALGRSINASSTCGVGSQYCILFTSDCFNCSPESINSPSSINDNSNDTDWYSAIGPEGMTTNIQIDFEAPVLFQEMTMVWQSVRPRSMLLERSQDFGATWQVYRYYSSSCEDSFILPDTIVDDSTVFNTTDPVCTSSHLSLGDLSTNGLVSQCSMLKVLTLFM